MDYALPVDARSTSVDSISLGRFALNHVALVAADHESCDYIFYAMTSIIIALLQALEDTLHNNRILRERRGQANDSNESLQALPKAQYESLGQDNAFETIIAWLLSQVQRKR